MDIKRIASRIVKSFHLQIPHQEEVLLKAAAKRAVEDAVEDAVERITARAVGEASWSGKFYPGGIETPPEYPDVEVDNFRYIFKMPGTDLGDLATSTVDEMGRHSTTTLDDETWDKLWESDIVRKVVREVLKDVVGTEVEFTVEMPSGYKDIDAKAKLWVDVVGEEVKFDVTGFGEDDVYEYMQDNAEESE